VIVTAKGKPVAALVGIKNADIATVSVSNNPKFLVLLNVRDKDKKQKRNFN
jgi:antitoxin (DNA-binding transcriptional repressor) of toxin-antitoxin stability system